MDNARRGAAGRLDNNLDRRVGAGVGTRGDKRGPRDAEDSQPTLRQALRARSGSRSAMTETSSPAIIGTWFRNIDPNLPAPISPTRTGRPAAARCCNRR
jgi:hypothetical protein